MDEEARSHDKRFAMDVSVLVIGVEGIGKSLLAKTLLKESSLHEIPPIDMKVELHSKISPDLDLLDTELVVVIIDLTKKNSLDILDSMNCLEYSDLLGKMCFVVLGTKQLGDRVVNVGDIQPKLAYFNSPIFYCGFKGESEFEILSPKLMNIILTTSGLKPFVSPAVLSWNCAHPLTVPEDLIGDT